MVLAAPQRVDELIYGASPPPAAGCSGAPAETFSYVADGTCRQAATDVCTGSNVASPCSYKATVTSDEKTFDFAGLWAGLVCTGKPVKPDSGPVPVGVCIPAGTVGIEFRVQGKNVSELVYQSAPPGPPIAPPPVPEAACDATRAVLRHLAEAGPERAVSAPTCTRLSYSKWGASSTHFHVLHWLRGRLHEH